MRDLKHWIGAALLAQPFYAEEIQMIGLLAQTWRIGLLGAWTATSHTGAATARHTSHLAFTNLHSHNDCVMPASG
ncbi:hypothetical protein [Novosphingobium sp. YAF33]|uniref:hypothetical protein n=1 Tax=Novosphingobium sp. YAF33 TaxID=3233082 RepID=UPI003F9E7392